MSDITSIQSGHIVPHQRTVEPRAPTIPASIIDDVPERPDTAPKEPDIVPSRAHPLEEQSAAREEIVAAVQDLRDAMSRLPGSAREVNLLYRQEDQSYLIEIRNKETGAVLQTFPPENLLNLSRRSADLLGVLIDRHS